MSDHRRRSIGNRENLPDLLLEHARTDGPTQQARAQAFSRIVAASAAATGVGIVAGSLANKGTTASVAKISTLVVAKWFVIGATAATAMLGAKEAVEHFAVSPAADPVPSMERNGRASVRQKDRASVEGRRALGAEGSPQDDRALPLQNGRALETPSVASGESMPSTPSPERAAAEAAPPRAAVPRPIEPQSEAASRRRTTPAAAADLAAPVSSAPTNEGPSPVASPPLSRELELLEKTRAHLARQSPWAALDALETYQATFPTGMMKTEAAALRVEALAAAGRREEALSHGRAFLSAHPQDPMSERVRGILVKLETPPSRP